MKPSPHRPAKTGLFRPRQFAAPPSLVLVPHFSEPALFAELRSRALRSHSFLHSTLLQFPDHMVISGFLGYPHLFTLLALVAGLDEKEVYFLGSAGALAPRFHEPAALEVTEVLPGGIFTRFSRRSLALERFAGPAFPAARAVSVDVIQRETPAWLTAQRARRADVVEMELYPLRWFLGRPFRALVVASDRVEATGIRPFGDRDRFHDEFHRAFQAITRTIQHEKSHPGSPL